MSILADKNTKVMVQGITGLQASFHVKRSMDCGTRFVAGVSPQKGGAEYLGVPVFDTVNEAVKETGATASVMFVPARFVKDAVREAVENELDVAVTIAYGVPVRDMMEIKAMLRGSKTVLIGPNTPGIITPGGACLGIFPENIHRSGNIGIVSRSSTLTYEAVLETSRAGGGQSTVVGLGDDMIVGTDFIEILRRFHEDEQTKALIMLGKLGGTYEEAAAGYYRRLPFQKPVIGYVAGSALPFGYKMGYAGDIITRGKITAEDKKDAMRRAGMIVVNNINEIHLQLQKLGITQTGNS